MKKAITILIISALVSCSNNEPAKTSTPNVVDTTKAADAEPAKEELINNWEYQATADKMTSDSNYFATVSAKEVLNFDFPYDGGSIATLTIRKKRKSTDVYLRVTKGQFNSSISDNTIKIRFDEEKPFTLGYDEASDGSSDVIFLQSVSKIVSKIKIAKKILIEVEFYNNGLRQIEFDVAGLDWKH